MDIWHLAWKNLWRNKRRTLITLAAIGLSMALVQAFHNLSTGVYARMVDAGVRAGSGHLALYRQGYAAARDEKLSFALDQLQQSLQHTEIRFRLSNGPQFVPFLQGLADNNALQIVIGVFGIGMKNGDIDFRRLAPFDAVLVVNLDIISVKTVALDELAQRIEQLVTSS